jgi:hypothetical protein
MSEAMSDSRRTTALPPLPNAAADGGGEPTQAHAEGRRLAMPPSLRADRPVVREAVREAARRAVDEAVTLGARASAVALTRAGAGAAAVAAAPSPALVGHLGHLRATLTRYVGERRDAGAPVERVLPEVKDLVREAAARELWFDTDDALMGQVVRWTIAAYYADPEPSDGSRAD